MTRNILLALILAISVIPVSCGGDGGGAPESVRDATIRIQAAGSFVDPEVGQQLNIAGSGSGFIIDPSGIAVTNNHVVTGAAYLQVWVEGKAEPYNAKVLGVSECSDLAVIDIDGDGFPAVKWYEGDIKVGLDVYAAGYPLGSPEFTLTRGIVSREKSDGETSWASIDSVIMHDATINPGNSGGPLVDEKGRVVAINYAGSSGVNQYFAIAKDKAMPIIDQLRAGQDVSSIGVNGEAVNDGEGLSGIWVASVESGSPADNAGIKAGDIITKMERLVLATDGTMAEYCDILRTHDPGDALSIEVLRYATQEILEGQLNGRGLTQSFSFAHEFGRGGGGGGAGSGSYYYVTVTDETGALTMDIPSAWSDIDGSIWMGNGGLVGASISAAGDLNAYNSTWTEPGVEFLASQDLVDLSDGEILDLFHLEAECSYTGRSYYEDPVYTGQYDYYTNCGGLDTQFLMLVAAPASREYVILLGVQVVSKADLEAMDRILDTFYVVGELP